MTKDCPITKDRPRTKTHEPRTKKKPAEKLSAG
jgi:hypothetical protein